MKSFKGILTLLAVAGFPAWLARAQIEVVANAGPQQVFFGSNRMVSVTFHNAGRDDQISNIHTRILQTSSATRFRLGEPPWKTLQILPGQTVLESAALDFPPVNAETKFLVQWLENTNHVIGTTEVRVYPANLLDELKDLTADRGENLGVLDPHRQLKAALKMAAIKYVDLEDAQLTNFTGRLALVGPCRPDDPEWTGLTERISQAARAGTPVVWMQSPPRRRGKLWPSFYIVPKSRAVVVVVEPKLVADLPDNPQSQLNLIYFCKLALRPEWPGLPDLSLQP